MAAAERLSGDLEGHRRSRPERPSVVAARSRWGRRTLRRAQHFPVLQPARRDRPDDARDVAPKRRVELRCGQRPRQNQGFEGTPMARLNTVQICGLSAETLRKRVSANNAGLPQVLENIAETRLRKHLRKRGNAPHKPLKSLRRRRGDRTPLLRRGRRAPPVADLLATTFGGTV